MKLLIILVTVVSTLAQTIPYTGLTSTPDGSALYFSSELSQPGYNQSPRSKIFRITPTGLELVIDVAPPDSNDGDRYRVNRGATNPVLNSQGWLVGWSVQDVCEIGMNFNCAAPNRVRIRSYKNSKIILERISNSVSAPIYSASTEYALIRSYAGLGNYNYSAVNLDTAKQSASPSSGYYPDLARVADNGDYYASDDLFNTVRVHPFRWGVPVAPIGKIGSFNAITGTAINIATQAYLVWRDPERSGGTRLEAYRFDGVLLRQRTLVEDPRVNCTEGQATLNGRVVMLCDSITPFWIWKEGATLEPLPVNLAKPKSWALAANGEVLWMVDSKDRILQYFLTTGELRTRLDGELRIKTQ